MFLGYKGILFAAAAAVCFLNVNAVSITELSEITDPDGVYELSSDIVLDESFVQLGTEQAPFTGSFDGNGFTITVNGTSPFGFVKNAELSDFAVSGVVSSKENFGGIVGSAEGATTIKNCSFSGTLDSCGEGIVISAGGIAGTVGSEASVINCSSNVSLTCEKLPYLLNAGGISGRNQGTVSQCASSGELSVISEK